MIKRLSYILYTLLVLLVFVGCADESDVQPDANLDFCVRAAWQNGQAIGKTSRALIATDILAEGTGDIAIDYADYPATIEVTCSDGNHFTLTKGANVCASHPAYWTYTPSFLYSQKTVIRHQLRFHATAQIDEPTNATLCDELEGDFDYRDINGSHMLFVLHHTRSLLRFTFKVSEEYDKVRYILITGIKLNGEIHDVSPTLLNVTAHKAITYCYIDPDEADLSTKANTLECTYSIYDKDAQFVTEGGVVTDASITANVPHLTRKDVTARNTFKLNTLKDNGGNPIPKPIAGYYYDLRVTLNPDYLYVLSEHDNKHITIE